MNQLLPTLYTPQQLELMALLPLNGESISVNSLVKFTGLTRPDVTDCMFGLYVTKAVLFNASTDSYSVPTLGPCAEQSIHLYPNQRKQA